MKSKYKILIKILSITIFLLGVVSIYVYWQVIGDNETYILPNGYKGAVTVIFNREEGQKPKYEQGKRIYEIPSNGVLITQFSPNEGWHKPAQYFYKKGDELIEIPNDYDKSETNTNVLKACCTSIGVASKYPHNEQVTYNVSYVGTNEDIHSIFENGKEPFPPDLIK
jgi:hypothetical protein